MEYSPATNLKIIVNRESVIHPSTFFVQQYGTQTEARLITADELTKRFSEWMDPIFPLPLNDEQAETNMILPGHSHGCSDKLWQWRFWG